MPKIIDYTLPVEFLSGNISGRQELTYAQGGEAYDAPNGVVTSAENYQARLIACRRWKKNRNYFCVRTKTSVNMSGKYRSSLAVMGGAGAIYTALTHMKESAIYAQCVAATPKGMTLRGFLMPIIMNALAAKDANIVIADGVTIVNPWVSSASPNVPVTTYNYNKFIDVLGSAELNNNTKQAIMDAFGDDGAAVIAATITYLNGIALTDPTKARALARLINEDPMIVCSLGMNPTLTTLPSMPVRMCADPNQSSGQTAYIDLHVVIDATKDMEIKTVSLNNYSANLFGVRYNNSNTRIYIQNAVFTYGENNTAVEGVSGVLNYDIKIHNNTTTWSCNGIQGTSQTSNFTHNNNSPYFMGVHHVNILQGGYNTRGGTFIFKHGNYDLWLIPFKHNGTMEFIDMNASLSQESNVYADRQGSFTEVFYLTDGTPWTPNP